MLKENVQLKKEMININTRLLQRKDEITKNVKENNNFKEEIKTMNKIKSNKNRKPRAGNKTT